MAETAPARAIAVDIADAGTFRKKVTVRVSPQKVDEVLEAIVREFSSRASIPGFRPGKAPRAMIERNYRADIVKEAQKRLSEMSFQTLHTEASLQMIGRMAMDPELTPVVERGKEYAFAFTTDVQPALEMVDPATIEVEQEELTIFDEEIDARLSQAAKRAGEHQSLKEGAVIADDQLLIDYTVAVDGQEVDKLSGGSWTLHGDHLHGPLPGDVKTSDLIGKLVGTPFPLALKLGKDFKVETAREKDATVTVTITGINRVILAPVDDKLAQNFGLENVARLKETVRESILNEVEGEIHQAVLDKLIDELIKRISFPLPEHTFESAKKMFYNDFLSHYRLTEEALEKMGNEKFKTLALEVSAKQAERSIRSSFIVDQYAHKHSITVPPEEFQSELESIAERNGMDLKKLLKKVDQSQLMEMEHNLRTQKTLEYLLTLAKVKIIPRKKPDLSGHGHDHGHSHDDHAGHDHAAEGHEHVEGAPAAAEGHTHEGHEHPHVEHDKTLQNPELAHPAPDHGHKGPEHGHKGHQHGQGHTH